MIKKILLVLGILVVLFAGINTAAALNSSILDVISGLPLNDQILFIAKEVDRLKLKDVLRDACDLTKDLEDAPGKVEIYRQQLELGASGTFVQNMGEEKVTELLDLAEEKLGKYNIAKADCDRLTEEFNQKYGR